MLPLHESLQQNGFDYIDPRQFREEPTLVALHQNAALAMELTEAVVARQLKDPTSCETLGNPLVIPGGHPVTDAFWELQQYLHEQKAFTQICSEIGIHAQPEEIAIHVNGKSPNGEIVLFPESTEEEIEMAKTLLPPGKTAMVFGSASMPVPGADKFGEYLGSRGYACMVGGDGIHPLNPMRQILEGAKRTPESITGIISTQFLIPRQGANPNVDFTIVARNFRHRKEVMYALGDVFPTMPGGMGSVDEVVTTIKHNLEAIQQGQEPKPIYIMDSQYWNPLMRWLDTLGLSGMVQTQELPQ